MGVYCPCRVFIRPCTLVDLFLNRIVQFPTKGEDFKKISKTI